jgi:hypothetical protein
MPAREPWTGGSSAWCHRFAGDLAEGLADEASEGAERSLLVEDVKIGCTLGMLQCLDRPHRLAYVLGEIFELPGPEAAEVLGIGADVFRKRLQHARAAVETFTRQHCGLVTDAAACACHRRVPAAIRAGRARGDRFDFAASAASFQDLRATVRRVEGARRAVSLHRSSHPRASTVDFARRVVEAAVTRPS